MKFLRKISRCRWFGCFLGEFEWFRKLHGGQWAQVHVDGPVNSCLWLDIPDDADPSYREPGWRGTPTFVTYP